MEIALLRSRVLIVLAAVVSAGIGLLASRALGVPPVDGLDISLLNGDRPVVSLLVVAIVFVGCAVLGSFAVRRSSEEVGLFVAAVGLAVFSVRGGSISTTLRYGDGGGGGIFVKLAIELVLLYAIVAAALVVIRKVVGPGVTADPAADDDETGSRNHHLMAVGVQAVTMAVVMFVLGHSESKKQAIIAVGVAAYLGSIAAHYTFPIQRGQWLALGPLVVGLVGYLLERSHPALASIGLVQQPLAIALPIDYASAGIIGGILGHWVSLKWAREAAGETAVPTATTPV
jgi:hypothetical protein